MSAPRATAAATSAAISRGARAVARCPPLLPLCAAGLEVLRPRAVPFSRLTDNFLDGTSSVYLEELQCAWEADPSSVDESWDNFFRRRGDHRRRRRRRPHQGSRRKEEARGGWWRGRGGDGGFGLASTHRLPTSPPPVSLAAFVTAPHCRRSRISKR
ncbi:hypothetical protein E2562_020851 [Oryza meyeriana var. granulata]|uniref:2-oxoglutarate dehydrogenase E1 component N-terminal domain-containing protein n=1 Tax=Oryza meyeriana var. granulata TaxID=110450 RepID=A0A6G1D7L5_9ORYZ|nr:hypothetical protein E2562_020851 [Oryza meyeriana var. granulata]